MLPPADHHRRDEAAEKHGSLVHAGEYKRDSRSATELDGRLRGGWLSDAIAAATSSITRETHMHP
jgi:hypothetical protein